MPENTEVIDNNAAPGGEQPGGTPPPAPPPNQVAPPPAVPPKPPDKTVVVPTSAMKRIKEEEFNKGRQAALEELAKSRGYSSHEELVAALDAARGQPAREPAQQPPAPTDDVESQLAQDKEARREEGRYQRQLEKVLNERNKFAQSATEWRKRADEAKAEADATKAEMYLRTVAASVGIQDIDYAIVLFSREVERMTPEQAEAFDEKAWFTGLRQTKPMLFGETVVPVTTGTGAGGAPKPPAPPAVAKQNGADGKTDVRKMNPAEYQRELQRRGITPGH